MTDWNKIKHFKPEEFASPDCKCAKCSCNKMNPTLVYALDYVRTQLERPLKVNSAYRSEEHNRAVGGAKRSQHLLGNAADIHIDNQEMGDMIEYWFTDYLSPDEVGIGRYNTFIHLDVRGHKARWDYRK